MPCIPLSLRINYDSTRKAISIVAILRLSRLVTCKAFWLEEPWLCYQPGWNIKTQVIDDLPCEVRIGWYLGPGSASLSFLISEQYIFNSFMRHQYAFACGDIRLTITVLGKKIYTTERVTEKSRYPDRTWSPCPTYTYYTYRREYENHSIPKKQLFRKKLSLELVSSYNPRLWSSPLN